MLDKDILREYIWVVLNSGMRNSVIESKWNQLSEAFRFFDLKQIIDDPDAVLRDALRIFGHYGKIDACVQFAKKLWRHDLTFRKRVRESPLKVLVELPFIGDVTKYHLARNLGFDFIKPDRHLVRLADQYGMTAFELCQEIHEKTGRKLGVIDVIFWRWSERKGQTILKKNG